MPMVKSLKERMMVLNEMDEIHLLALQTREAIQKHRKKCYDHHLKDKKKMFKEGDRVLLYDSQYKKHPRKLKMCSMGPYWVVQDFDNGSIQLAKLKDKILPTRVNGTRLKKYFSSSTS